MEEILILILMLALCFLLVLLGIPVAFSLGFVCIVMIFTVIGVERISLIGGIVYGELANFSLVALPLYVLMAQLLNYTGIVERAFAVLARWIKNLPGALFIVTNLTGTLLAACTGSSAGNAAALGTAALPQMLKFGYDKRIAAGLIAASGSLGILIPPSTLFIIFGIVTEQSVGKLFLAGFFPGIMISAFFMIYMIVRCMINPN
ncbi:MAG: TRAP transporter large permease subunit, partial [Chloroflexota bacterium]